MESSRLKSLKREFIRVDSNFNSLGNKVKEPCTKNKIRKKCAPLRTFCVLEQPVKNIPDGIIFQKSPQFLASPAKYGTT